MRKVALYSFIIFLSTIFSLGFADDCIAAVNSSSKKTTSTTNKNQAQTAFKKSSIIQPQQSVKVNNVSQSQVTIKNSNTQEKQIFATTAVKDKIEVHIIEKAVGQIQGYGIDKDGTVTLDDKYFSYLNFEIEENPGKYAGQKVDIIGFIDKSPNYKENEFKVARIELSRCGSKDNTVIGLICQTENASDFRAGEWVRVKGKLVTKIYKDPQKLFEYAEVYIQPVSIERVPKQEDIVY